MTATGIHLGIALLYLAMLPIGTAPAIILSVPLAAISIVRWRLVAAQLPALLRWAPGAAALLLAAWLALSLLWSDDAARGGHLLLSLRALLLPVLLAPLLAHRAWLAGALLGGITTQAVVQGIQYLLQRGAWNFDGLERFGGFTSDPGKAGLWDALGVCGGAALALVPGGAAGAAAVVPWIGGAIAAATLLGAVASGTRRQLVALAVVIPALVLWTIATLPRRRRRAASLLAAGVVAAAAAWPLVGPSVMTRARQTIAQWRDGAARDGATRDDPLAPPMRGIVHYDLRGYYWDAALAGWRAHPLRGLGLGAASRAIAASPRRGEVEPWLRAVMTREYPGCGAEEIERDLVSRLESDHPHSTWLQLLVEGGLVGLALGAATWGLAWFAALRRALAAGDRDPVPLACTAALLVWAIGALFDASINSSSLSAVVVVALLGGFEPAPHDDRRPAEPPPRRAAVTPPRARGDCRARS